MVDKLTNLDVVNAGSEVIKIVNFAGKPPEVEYSVFLYNDFQVDAYRRKMKIAIRDIIDGFSNRVSKYSQIDAIIARLIAKPVDIHTDLRFMANKILNTCDNEEDAQKQRK